MHFYWHLKVPLGLRLLLAALLSSLPALNAQHILEPDPARVPKISGTVPGELIVRFKPGASEAQKARVAKKVKAAARDVLAPSAPIARLGGPRPPVDQMQIFKVTGNLDQARAALEKEPDVLYAEPNFKTRLFGPVTPNDFEFESLYAMHNAGGNEGKVGADIKAPEAWEVSIGSRDILVAVIDTGMDYFHEDLRGNAWTNAREIPGNGIDDDANGYIDDVYGYDFISNDIDPFDDHFHGTHVAGTIGAVGNNGIGVAGVCWQVRLLPIKAFDETGSGSVASAVAAIHYAVVNGARVINASWGLEDRSRALSDAVVAAQAAGIVFVAAAGNSRTDRPFYPAGYDSVICVASTNNRDERSQFSNYGPHVDLSAPGEQILSTVPDGRYDMISGTSMAAPHVAGAAALILARHPNFTATQVATILKNTTDPVSSERAIGQGRVNVNKAIRIDLPLPNAVLKIPTTMFGSIEFRGTASGEHFQRYTLAYGAGVEPATWTEFFSSTTPVSNDHLVGGFDSSTLNDGPYTFRLTVFNDNGQSASDLIAVKVLNVQVSFPLSADIARAGSPLVIRGTVFGQGRHFGLEWSKGLAQSEWFATGFSQPTNGEVLEGILGTFDTGQVAPNDFYSFRLSATNSAGGVQRFSVSFVWLDSRLRPGWPIYLPYDGEYALEDWRQAKVADLDGDRHQEILIVDHGNSEGKIARLLVFNHDATLKWSRELNGDEPYADVPTMADMDGDGKLEIFVDVGSKLYAFDQTGADLPGLWPLTLSARGFGKVAADLDGDGKKEIVALANSPSENSPGVAALNVYDREGHVLQHWNLTACNATNVTQRMFPVVANMDDDRDLEIVVVTACNSLAVYKMNLPDAPLWSKPLQGSAISSPVVADLDRDGQNDIVVTTWSASQSGGIYLFDHRGRIHPGWPALEEDSFPSAAAVGDLNGDGFLEIVATGDRLLKLHALGFDGFELAGWPASISNHTAHGGITLADITGDNVTDVLYTAPGYMTLAVSENNPSRLGGISAWNARGERILLNGESPYASILTEGAGQSGFFKASPVTVTDLDHNGQLDLVAASIRDRTFVPFGQSAAFKNRSSLYAWELAVPPSDATLAWPQFHRGADNNAFLPIPKPPPAVPDLLPIPEQIVAVGQPFPLIPLDQFVNYSGEIPTGLTWTAAPAGELRAVIDLGNLAHVTTPTANWEGSDVITFTLSGAMFSKSVSVLYSAREGFFPPITVADHATTVEDTPIEIDVLANDSNATGGLLSLIDVSRPAQGKAILVGGRILYQPSTNYAGSDSFTYFIQNEAGAKALGTVTLVIAAVNDVPLAGDDRALTFEGRPVVVNVLANDFDADLEPLALSIVTAPANGAVEILADQKIQFTPARDFNGTNDFTYAIRDPLGLSATGRVTIIIRPLNSAPIALPQSVVMNRNSEKEIRYLAEDAEGDSLTFRIVKAPAHAELYTYPLLGLFIPAKGYFGEDSFTYRASDGQLEGPEALVQITIRDLNNPPTPKPLSITTRINQAVTIGLSAIDVDDDPITYRIVTPPAQGVIDGVGTNFVYTPNFGYLGKDEFTFAASDGRAEASAKVTLETTEKNTAPGANLKFVKTFPNTPVSFLLSGADAESNPLAFQLVSEPLHGALTGGAPYLVYHPGSNYLGPDRFKFTVSDSEFTSEPASVTLSVLVKNALPIATAQTVTGYAGQPLRFNLAVRDPDGDPLQIVILKGVRSGRLTGPISALLYTPHSTFGSVDTFTYRAWDGHNYGNEAQVRIDQLLEAPTPAGFDSIRLTDLGDIQLSVTNRVGESLLLESSPDYTHWEGVTNVRATNGKFLFSITPTNAQIYFRAVAN